MSPEDKRALHILFESFWSPGGWKPEASRGPSRDDFIYAKSKGVMFDPITLDHELALNELLSQIADLDKRRVVDAFLASLSTRRLDWRSSLGSYAVFQHLPHHAPITVSGRCSVCGMYLIAGETDLSILNFERHKWGGVRHRHVEYAALDLRLFRDSDAPKPTSEDVQIFRNIMSAIAAVPSDITSASVHTHFAKCLKSNKAERDVIVAVLGYCGILGTPEHPGFSGSFVPYCDRKLPDRRFVDMPYPACWWSGKVGINQAALGEFFGHIL